jgi:hypothetical protein
MIATVKLESYVRLFIFALRRTPQIDAVAAGALPTAVRPVQSTDRR